jgi:hypothetical protein
MFTDGSAQYASTTQERAVASRPPLSGTAVKGCCESIFPQWSEWSAGYLIVYLVWKEKWPDV